VIFIDLYYHRFIHNYLYSPVDPSLAAMVSSKSRFTMADVLAHPNDGNRDEWGTWDWRELSSHMNITMAGRPAGQRLRAVGYVGVYRISIRRIGCKFILGL
jgi:hypothetical protein